MKILVIQETSWTKRGPHQSHHLFERLSEIGHEIRVIDFTIDWYKQKRNSPLLTRKRIRYATPKVVSKSKILVISSRFIKIRGLDLFSIGISQFFDLLRQIKAFEPDVVVSFGIVCGFSASTLCKIFRIPFCEYWIDVLHEIIPYSSLKPLGLILGQKTIKQCNLFLAINEQLLDYGLRFKPVSHKLIRAGVDIQAFSPNELCKKKERKKLNLSNSDIVLFFAGYLYDFSGLKEIIQELSNKKQNNRLKLVIAGDGDQMATLEHLVREFSMENQIRLLGWQPYERIPSLISASDICLLPAYNNSIMRDIVPIKIYEYLALSKPVVSTLLPGIIREFNTGNGVVYVKKPEDVVKRCSALVKGRLVKKLGKEGRNFVEKNCDWKIRTGEFLKELESIVDAG